jgi:hypothetical protein
VPGARGDGSGAGERAGTLERWPCPELDDLKRE